jgi:hypothetical protein
METTKNVIVLAMWLTLGLLYIAFCVVGVFARIGARS